MERISIYEADIEGLTSDGWIELRRQEEAFERQGALETENAAELAAIEEERSGDG